MAPVNLPQQANAADTPPVTDTISYRRGVDYNKVLGRYPYVPTREPELELAMSQYAAGIYFRRTASQLKDDAERERRAAGKPLPETKPPEKRMEPPTSDDPPGAKQRRELQAKALRIRQAMEQRPRKRKRRN